VFQMYFKFRRSDERCINKISTECVCNVFEGKMMIYTQQGIQTKACKNMYENTLGLSTFIPNLLIDFFFSSKTLKLNKKKPTKTVSKPSKIGIKRCLKKAQNIGPKGQYLTSSYTGVWASITANKHLFQNRLKRCS
jgi:hypothetical protein